MPRKTGAYRVQTLGGEAVRSFIPAPLPPKNPPLQITEDITNAHTAAMVALGRLNVAALTVTSPQWFLYSFVRKEAVISSQIEGTQATLEDMLVFEATRQSERPDDIAEVCNYLAGMEYARRELARPKGLPLCSRLLCQVHQRLMKGTRGADKHPGKIRTSQNWIGGSRPGNAVFVPPPATEVPEVLSKLDKWIHADDALPPLIRAGLAHVQFETIHPFLDGNGRVGRMLITLLLEHWQLLDTPLLYLSLAFKRHRETYYQRLNAVRLNGDWEGWTTFFLNCVIEAAEDAVASAAGLFRQLHEDRQKLLRHKAATVSAIRLFDLLPEHPVLTMSLVVKLLKATKPTAQKAIEALEATGIMKEQTGRKRDRVYGYRKYLDLLSAGTELEPVAR